MKTDISAPYLSSDKIQLIANRFRDKHWEGEVPVDMEKIIEFKLGIQLIPVPGLKSLCDIDALITSNWKYIYVDHDCYMDERHHNRLRFSLAHEVGHYVLHKKVYESFGVENIEDFYTFSQKVDEQTYYYFETQANKFANALLVSSEKLIQEREKLLKDRNEELKVIKRGKIDEELFNSFIANKLSDTFGVNGRVVEIALTRKECKL